MDEPIISNKNTSQELPYILGLNILQENTLFNNVFPELKAIIIRYFKANKKYEKLSEYERDKNFDKYFTTLIFMADRGCPISQKKLLQDYMIGKNFQQNHGKNLLFYKANENYSYSASYLGWMLEHGYGVLANKTLARTCYEKAIELGNSIAMNNLAVEMCRLKDEKSIELFKKSAELGNPFASWNLGEIYKDAKFGERNRNLAIKYYIDALKQDHYKPSEILGILIDLYAKK